MTTIIKYYTRDFLSWVNHLAYIAVVANWVGVFALMILYDKVSIMEGQVWILYMELAVHALLLVVAMHWMTRSIREGR